MDHSRPYLPAMPSIFQFYLYKFNFKCIKKLITTFFLQNVYDNSRNYGYATCSNYGFKIQTQSSYLLLLLRSSKLTTINQNQKVKENMQYNLKFQTNLLKDLFKRYNPPPPISETSLPLKKSSCFEKLDVATRLELDHELSHVIDVQPDLRFPFQYFMFNIAEDYPELTSKAHPYVSTFTLIAYEQLLFNAYLLACDLHARDTLSYHATFYKNNSLRSD